MSKKREERANYYLYINGQAVPVSEQVYRVYQHYERKEEYFSYDLKTEKFQKDTATFLPSREDSFERLLETDRQFAVAVQPVEEQAVSSVWLEELLQCLSADERIILRKLYFEDKSERIASMELGISKTALHQRKVKLLQKLRHHRTIWQEHSAKDFASYESYKRAGILYVFPTFIAARMGQKIGRRPQTQLCGDALIIIRLLQHRAPCQSRIRDACKIAMRLVSCFQNYSQFFSVITAS